MKFRPFKLNRLILLFFTVLFFCLLPTRNDIRKNSPVLAEQIIPEIAFYSEMIYPGRKFHFKVVTVGPTVAKVSISLNEKIVPLYSQDLVTWKGDTVISSIIRPGRYPLTIYVADVDGHLYTEKIEVAVEPLPEINVIKCWRYRSRRDLPWFSLANSTRFLP